MKKTYTIYGNKIRVDLESMIICLIQRQRNLTPDELVFYLYIQRQVNPDFMRANTTDEPKTVN